MSSEDMNLSVNGQSQVPPGFRFHPTEEELLLYYLRKKVGYEKIDLDVIRDVDLNKLEPWDIQEKCKIGSTPQNDWYFFSHKDKKYPTGTRTNRATAAGFWKATGRDKVIHSSLRRIGMRKTLVFYKGRAPHGQKSDWIMHEYRLDDSNQDTNANNNNNNIAGDPTATEEGWVVCRVFKKKNYHKALESPQSSSTTSITTTCMDSRTCSQMRNTSSSNDVGILDQILEYMGRSCKQEDGESTIIMNNANLMVSSNTTNHNMLYLSSICNTAAIDVDGLHHQRFAQLPRLLENNAPTTTMPSLNQHLSSCTFKASAGQLGREPPCTNNNIDGGYQRDELNDWVALEKLVACQLNGQDHEDNTKHLSCYNKNNSNDDPNDDDFCFSIDHDDDGQFSHLPSDPTNITQSSQPYNSEIDLWSFARSSSSSSSDPLCHLSV